MVVLGRVLFVMSEVPLYGERFPQMSGGNVPIFLRILAYLVIVDSG